MSCIKEQYRRFRRWQQQPFDYHDTSDRHVCCNCGREAENNYCPRCGQKAVYGPITWSTAEWLTALKYPLISLGVALALIVVGESIAQGAFTKFLYLLYFN